MDKHARNEDKKARIRVRLKKMAEAASRLRLSVFRSNRKTYAQIIDDAKGETLVSVSEADLSKEDVKKKKSEKSALLGKILAEKAKAKKITKVYFDRGSYKYQGRIKALAEEARKAGLDL